MRNRPPGSTGSSGDEKLSVTRYPLSAGQWGLWTQQMAAPDSAVYDVHVAGSLRGALDVTALRHALQLLVNRHPALRTTFQLTDGGVEQVVRPIAEWSFRQEMASRWNHRALCQRVAGEVGRPFDLEHGPLFAALVLTVTPTDHVLLLRWHHLIVDNVSQSVLLTELHSLYQALVSHRVPVLPPLDAEYSTFVRRQAAMLAGAEGAGHQRFWEQRLAEQFPRLRLPYDRAPARSPSLLPGPGTVEAFTLDGALTARLRSLAEARGTHLSTVLFAAFTVLLHRYTQQTAILVRSLVHGRSRPEFKHLVGYFVNSVVIDAHPAAQTSFARYLTQVDDATTGIRAHQDYPLARVVENLRARRSPNAESIFQVAFNMVRSRRPGQEGLILFTRGQAGGRVQLGELTLESLPFGHGWAQAELMLLIEDRGDDLLGMFEYATALFDAGTIARLGRHFRTLLHGIVSDPECAIGRLPLVAPDEALTMPRSQQPAVSRVAARCLHDAFDRQAGRTPGATAVVFNGTSLSYAELNERANGLAHHLQSLGAEPDTLVALCAERSLDLVVGILGILKAGAAYVPLDPSYPTERLHCMVSDSRAPIILAQGHLIERLGDHPCIVDLDMEGPELMKQPSTRPVHQATEQNLAYVIYTSGSTGRPKGAMVSHANVMRLFETTRQWFRFDENDVWTLFHSVAFDFSVWEMWGALLHGGTLVVVDLATCRSPADFIGLLRAERVTILNQTPSVFRALLLPASERLHCLRWIIFGGEALNIPSLRPWVVRDGGAPGLVNMYGITETTVHVTYRPITARDIDADVPSLIGCPLPDLDVRILDPALQPCPPGVLGELYVGGPGLARGYLNQPALTAERFIPDPFGAHRGGRLYRSGDLARRLPNGDIEYMGRGDHQVKIRGFRIELGEIESTLHQHPSVRDALVVASGDDPSTKQLLAYVVLDHASAAVDLRRWLMSRLPDYMIPAAIIPLPSFPVTVNGKVDRDALLRSHAGEIEGEQSYVPPGSDLEKQIAQLWQDILGIERVGLTDDFFSLGGHSLHMGRIVARLDHLYGVRLNFSELYDASTVAGLARLVAERAGQVAVPYAAEEGGVLRFGDAVAEENERVGPDADLLGRPS